MIQTNKPIRLSDMLTHRNNNIVEAASMNISIIGIVRQNCCNIEQIDLRQNDIQKLDGIEQFKKLRRVDLRDCRIMDQKELLKLRKCTRLERVWLQGNPFLRKGLTESTLALLIGLENDVVVDSEGSRSEHSQSVKIPPELEREVVETHNQLEFLESLLRRLELHSQLANEYTMEDEGPNILTLLKMRKSIQKMDHGILERFENPTQQNIISYLEKQKDKIQEITAIIHKKAEVLQGLRHMASLDRTKQQEKHKRNPLSQKNLNLIEPPITQKQTKKPLIESDISVSFSSGLQNSKELQYRMVSSQATEEYDTKHCYQKILDSRMIQPSKFKKSKTRLIDKPHPPLNAPTIIKHHLWLHRILVNESNSYDQKQQICTFIQNLLREQHETDQKMQNLTVQLNQAQQQMDQLQRKLEQKQQEINEREEEINVLRKNLEIEQKEAMKFSQLQENNLEEHRERCMAAEASIEALIITEKNEEVLMIAKEVSLKKQYFHMLFVEAQRRQQEQQKIDKHQKKKQLSLKKQIFDVILREAIVNKMYFKKLESRQQKNLSIIFGALKNEGFFNQKQNFLELQRKRQLFINFYGKVTKKKNMKQLKQFQDNRQLNEAKLQLTQSKVKLIFNFLKNASKLSKFAQNHKIMQLSSFLQHQKTSQYLSILKQRVLRIKQHRRAKTNLLKFLEESRLIQFYQAGMRKKHQNTIIQCKIRKIHHLYVRKVCQIFKKRQELEQTLKVRRICSFFLRISIVEPDLQQKIKTIRDTLSNMRKVQTLRQVYSNTYVKSAKLNQVIEGMDNRRSQQHSQTEKICKFTTWKLFTSKMKNFKLRQQIALMQPAMQEIKERESRILRLEQKWKEELQKKDERCLLYEKKLQEISYEVIQRDIRFEKLKAVYETTLDEVKMRQSQFLNIISKFQAAEEATLQAAKNKQEYQQAKKTQSIKRQQLQREYTAMSAGRKGKQEMTVLVSDFDTLRPNILISQPGTTVSQSTLNSLEASY